MASLNCVMLIGNLTRDPQLKYLPNQTAVCEFGIATTRKFKVKDEQREDTTFVECTCFGKAAETFSQWMAKGKPVFVQGRLKLDQWEDKNGGGRRSKLSVVVEDFQFLGGRDSGNQGGDETSQAPPSRPNYGQRPPAKTGAPQPPYGEEQQFTDSDLPF